MRYLPNHFQGPQKVKVGSDKVVTAKNIIIATGSVPFVPKGIEVDGKCVPFSSHSSYGFTFSVKESSILLLDGGLSVPVFYIQSSVICAWRIFNC